MSETREESSRRDLQPQGHLVNYDCRHYSGYKPCGLNPQCEGCEKYEPVEKRILIIKLGAMGDVLRTTAVLPALRREWPKAQVTWLTRSDSRSLLENNPLIDRLLIWGADSMVLAEVLEFDLVMNFEKELSALALAERVTTAERRGFRLTTAGTVGIADERAAYALRMGIDDRLKFQENTLTYQQMTCEMVGLDWTRDLYVFESDQRSHRRRERLLAAHPHLAEKTVIGVNTGCGDGFPTKRWSTDNLVDLITTLGARPEFAVLVLGGRRETEINAEIVRRCGGAGIDTGCGNSLHEFVGILMGCDVVVSADSLPMHLAIALGKPVVALFGPTTAVEVDAGPWGEKVLSDIECSPCYKTVCPETSDGHPLCMDLMGADQVLAALDRALAKSG